MVDRQEFLNAVENIYSEKPTYRKGGSGKDGTCDCIGLIIGGIERAGGSWPGTHGSNYAARYEVDDLHQIGSAEELETGDVVFKAYDPMDDNWDLPNNYAKHPDQNDYYHVGVVTSVSPLIITHCTTPTTTKDFKLGKWSYVGKLKKVNHEGGTPAEPKKAIVDKPAGTDGETVNLRTGAGKNYDRIAKVPFGTEVDVYTDLGDWCYVKVDGKSGYMMSNYILYLGDGDTEDDPIDRDEIPENVRQIIQQAIENIDKAVDKLVDLVGRG